MRSRCRAQTPRIQRAIGAAAPPGDAVLIRINLALIAVFLLAALAVALVSRSMLQANATREVLVEAGLMMDSAAAIRTYTSTEILPLLDEKMKTEFRPQSVPSYAATQNFLKLHEEHPDYAYKEATLNPTNPRDRASDWESDIVQKFRNDEKATEVSGERDTPMGRSLYLARPLRAPARCLVCHSVPAAAPATLLARYGSNNGFGWQADEVVGAQIVTVPYDAATASANRVYGGLMLALATVFLAVLLIVNGALYLLVVHPVRRIAVIADRLSLGDSSAPAFPTGGGSEISALAVSFERMRKSLDKALRLLGD
jgi:HAMP domain-containing protein